MGQITEGLYPDEVSRWEIHQSDDAGPDATFVRVSRTAIRPNFVHLTLFTESDADGTPRLTMKLTSEAAAQLIEALKAEIVAVQFEVDAVGDLPPREDES